MGCNCGKKNKQSKIQQQVRQARAHKTKAYIATVKKNQKNVRR